MDVDALFPMHHVNLSEHGADLEALRSSEISRAAAEDMEQEKASAVGKVIQQTSSADGVLRGQANRTVSQSGCGRFASPCFTTCCQACPGRHTGQCFRRQRQQSAAITMLWEPGRGGSPNSSDSVCCQLRPGRHTHQGLRHYEPQSGATLVVCQKGCGRLANPGYSTCCQACPGSHTGQCFWRQELHSGAVPMLCEHGCGRLVNPG